MLGSTVQRFLVVTVALGTALLGACADEAPVAFTHGVAAGDARADGAVLWTRVDREATLTVEVATDESFADVVVAQETAAVSEGDYTAKAVVSGLEPGTHYFYRFRRDADASDTGAFRTAPAEDETAPVRFIFSGGTDGALLEDGTRAFDFKVLNWVVAERADFFVYLGDTIDAGPPFGERAASLEGYREKYRANREVPALRRMLAATSVYSIWDDREVAGGFAGATVDPELLGVARQAFREYLPVGGDERPEALYRRFRWGSAVELIVLDGRSFRDESAEAACTARDAEAPDLVPALGDPDAPEPYLAFRSSIRLPEKTARACLAALNDEDRTMLGEEQKRFLLQALEESDAAFKFVVTPAPMSELIALPYDRWEGYRAERDEILGFIKEEGIENVVFLSAGYQASVVSNVRLDAVRELAARRTPRPVAVEFVAGPMAQETLGDALERTQGEELAGAFETLLEQVAQVSCVRLDTYSYGLVEVEPDEGTATVTLKDENGRRLCRRELGAS